MFGSPVVGKAESSTREDRISLRQRKDPSSRSSYHRDEPPDQRVTCRRSRQAPSANHPLHQLAHRAPARALPPGRCRKTTITLKRSPPGDCRARLRPANLRPATLPRPRFARACTSRRASNRHVGRTTIIGGTGTPWVSIGRSGAGNQSNPRSSGPTPSSTPIRGSPSATVTENTDVMPDG